MYIHGRKNIVIFIIFHSIVRLAYYACKLFSFQFSIQLFILNSYQRF